MAARNYKTKDMPLQDGHHRAIAFSTTSGKVEDVNKTYVVDDKKEPHDGPGLSAKSDDMDAAAGEVMPVTSDTLTQNTAPQLSTQDSQPEDTAAALTLYKHRYQEVIHRVLVLEKELHNLSLFRKLVKQEPILQQELGKVYFPGVPFMLLPANVRKQIAVFLIKSGHWELVGTCKKLYDKLGSLVSQHGFCEIVIGSPKLVNPKILRTDILQNIMNLKLFVLRTGDSFTSTVLDTNMNLLPLFRGHNVIRKRLELRLVGLLGVSWAITDDFLRNLPPIHMFEDFIFNIHVLHPSLDGSSPKLNWRDNMYNASINDMLIATKPFEANYGPYLLRDKGAMFRPYDNWKRGFVKAATASSSYTNNEGIFRFNKKQTDQHGRIIYRGNQSTSRKMLAPPPIIIPDHLLAIQQAPTSGTNTTLLNNGRPASTPSILEPTQQQIAIPNHPARAPQPVQSAALPALTVDTGMADDVIVSNKEMSKASTDLQVSLNTTRSMSTPLERTNSTQDGAQALLALATIYSYPTPTSARTDHASHRQLKQITEERFPFERRYEGVIDYHQPGVLHGPYKKDKYEQPPSTSQNPNDSRKHRRSSSSHENLAFIDLTGPAKVEGHRDQRRRHYSSPCSPAAQGPNNPHTTAKKREIMTKPKATPQVLEKGMAAMSDSSLPDTQRLNARPCDRRFDQIVRHELPACRNASIPPNTETDRMHMTSRKRETFALAGETKKSGNGQKSSDSGTGK